MRRGLSWGSRFANKAASAEDRQRDGKHGIGASVHDIDSKMNEPATETKPSGPRMASNFEGGALGDQAAPTVIALPPDASFAQGPTSRDVA